ncbi:Glutamyl aminopeptidase [Formica fusca]
MPIQEYKSVDNYTMCTVFQMTPPMSTNDVAILISDQILNKTDTMVDTWCRPHLILHMIDVHYFAGNVTEYLKDNFKILRKVPKVNYVSIPSLENRIRQTWGLVLYK